MMTSTAAEWEIKRAADAGADSYLVKPGDLEGVMRVVRDLPIRWAVIGDNKGAVSQAKGS
jgi:hypothetical protein